MTYYDYTKIPARLYRPKPANLYLTFSLSEDNKEEAEKILGLGLANVAVVFKGKTLPKTFMGKEVVDGNKHDLRFLDKQGCVVGLLAKGRAKKDKTGFVIQQGVPNA